MRETADWRTSAAPLTLPAEVDAQFAALAQALAMRSQIVWGEHCSECAFPACYSSCSFYTPRSDFNCRRFERGIEEVATMHRALTRIRFRKWGKLEGRGPVRLEMLEEAARREAADKNRTAIVRATPDERAATWLARRFNARKGAQSGGGDSAGANAFVIEAYLEDAGEIPFTLTIAPEEKATQGLYQQRFVLGQGYNRIVFGAARIASSVDLTAPFLVQIEPVGDAALGRDVVFGFTDFATFATPVRPVSPVTEKPAATAKCLVWDLDNTLWRGTLAEDGVEGLVLNEEAVAAIKALDARGILHSVASKNDPEPALAALTAFGLREYFLFPQIGWGPKSDSVRSIAGLLDIGLDTFVFIDDQAFERGEVGQALPMVRTLGEEAILDLTSLPCFDVPVTAESGKRRAMYQDEERRHAAAAETPTDYVAFLRSCGITLEISRPTAENADRLYELSQRTNQLNFSASRLTRNNVNQLVAGMHELDAYVMRCADSFGEYGIVGLVLVAAATATIEAFYMSCRVQRKCVENAFFGFLGRRLAADGHKDLHVRYKQSAKNGASARMLEELGFKGDAGVAAGEGVFTHRLDDTFDPLAVVRIDDRTQQARAS